MISTPLIVLVFVGSASLAMIVGLLVTGRDRRVELRLRDLSGRCAGWENESPRVVSQVVRSALPKIGKPLLPEDGQERRLLQTRLIHAGLYSPQAIRIYFGVKMLLLLLPVAVGAALGTMGLVPMNLGIMFGACGGLFGIIGPSFWLDRRKSQRQTTLRRALPDAMDLLVVCLDGGLSLTGGLRRIGSELRAAHPLLADELAIVTQESQLGHSTAESLRNLAARTDLAEIRGLAAVVQNAERFGAGLVKSLRTYGDTLRVKRQQQAEEMAQKAGTKILFPTLLFIFPAIFVIILGPAVFQIMDVLAVMK